MRRFVLAMMGCAALAAQSHAAQTFVSGRVIRSASGNYEVYEPFLRIQQWVSPFGSGSYSFNGWPFSGTISGHGDRSFSIFGGAISAQANEWGGNWRVQATVFPAGRPAVSLFFTLYAEGRTDDPQHPPSYRVFDRGSNLSLRPSLSGEYDMTGWVDRDQFGSVGTSLVGLVAAVAMDKVHAGKAQPAPRPAFEQLLGLATNP